MCSCFSALQRIKEAEENNNVESRLDEVEKLLRNIIKMPQKVILKTSLPIPYVNNN